MCCFSGPVRHVSHTQIYARLANGRQLTAYQMSLAAESEVAMVLPVPVVPGTAENGVRFIDLSGDPLFFSTLRGAFPADEERSRNAETSAGLPGELSRQAPLKVEQVGAFEASFVPAPRDFARLDPRFALSPEVLAALPQYADWGFVVFKLRPSRDEGEVHPMAFDFPTRTPGEAFFPCVHVHDGQVHERAAFDHQLYVQLGPQSPAEPAGWKRSWGLVGEVSGGGDAHGLLDRDGLAWMTTLRGALPNADVRVRARPATPDDDALREARHEARRELDRQQARERRSAVLRRVVRGLVSAPISFGLAFMVYAAVSGHRANDPDGLPSALVFGAALAPALAVLVEAVTGSLKAAGIAVLLAAAAIGAGLTA